MTPLVLSLLFAADLSGPLKTLRSVGREGDRSAEAAAAWRQVVEAGVPSLLPTLEAMDDASPLAANYLRSAADAVVENALAAKQPLPVTELLAFLAETKHRPAARRLAFETVVRVEPARRDELLGGFLDDRSDELRRDAVALELKRADELPKEKQLPRLDELFAKTREQDQIKELAARVEKAGGAKKKFTEHVNSITKFWVAAPFDNVKGVGYAAEYPPEKGVDLSASYTGKGGAKVTWKEVDTADEWGDVDLNGGVGKLKGAVAYAFAAVESPEERPAEIRLACATAVVVYLNGERIYGREEYHHGHDFDQYVARGTLKKGRNEILLKVCQNEQTEPWAQTWHFQCRVCDETGGKIPMTLLAK